jgi:hypothetical protein
LSFGNNNLLSSSNSSTIYALIESFGLVGGGGRKESSPCFLLLHKDGFVTRQNSIVVHMMFDGSVKVMSRKKGCSNPCHHHDDEQANISRELHARKLSLSIHLYVPCEDSYCCCVRHFRRCRWSNYYGERVTQFFCVMWTIRVGSGRQSDSNVMSFYGCLVLICV